MAFDGLLIHHLVDELKTMLVGGRVDKIFQPEKDELTLTIRGLNKSMSLFISVESSMPYFTLTASKKENPQAPPMFCMLLRKHITGGRIHKIEQLGYERVVLIEIESKNDFGEPELKKLIIEIMGKHSNIILTKEDFTIIDCIKRITPDMSRVRTLLPGFKYHFLERTKCTLADSVDTLLRCFTESPADTLLYKSIYTQIEGFSPLVSKYLCHQMGLALDTKCGDVPPETMTKLIETIKKLEHPLSETENHGTIYNQSNGLPKIVYFMKDVDLSLETVSYPFLYEALDAFYARSNHELKMHQKSNALKKTLMQRIERYTTKLSKQTIELMAAENADASRIIGELLLANLYQMSKGMNRITVLDYYVDPPVERDVELNTRLEPIENVQSYFKKYNKLKHAVIELKRQISETQSDVDYLEHVLTHLNQSDDSKIVNEIREELITQGYLKGRQTKKQAKIPKQTFRRYTSTDGFEILVGKSNLQNDQLTLKVASNKDVWLHTKDIPGSHVIIRTEGKEASETALAEAAMIAAHFSKAKDSSNVPVDYTLIKNVSKPSGAKPGMVIYVGNRTLFVTPSFERVTALENH